MITEWVVYHSSVLRVTMILDILIMIHKKKYHGFTFKKKILLYNS